MSLNILIKKLYLDEKKIITAEVLKKHCKSLKMEYNATARYLLRNKYLHRILRGIFYFPTIEERKLGRMDLNYLEALAIALEVKGVRDWYFGLETAIKLNNLSHEFFTTDYIMNDAIFRPKAILVLGHRIHFVKLKKSLFSFGIIDKKIRYSDPEKTILDMVYLARYKGLKNNEIKLKMADLLASCSVKKLLTYAKNYNREIKKLVREL